jgi:hypothetical protein
VSSLFRMSPLSHEDALREERISALWREYHRADGCETRVGIWRCIQAEVRARSAEARELIRSMEGD